ncbi:hypothetical protein LTR10_017671 [Elasticomyces elasticus]|uniref:CsbD-like domain-containing protein n=1 Tax=Exophiala sideris TaxID=1016849 RepID=A0ABR0JC96_9EURO|nr:hypothetical protein LTR10_017671 [Elasticomyces elasticus]KAK5031080.1 hypothetical protein LTS07_004815 [Exophiala sideris]KAK5038802.1 hypothetical protein LTR13_003833 [Exophiala sideris]KAK5060685.1 hypothetical protein LTR69_005284 [Exophiala sideris]KAK5183598.1 hypothetical protein LTR44_003880 [Eurotiomycetes sp. CCFEE 6388]
MSPGQPSLLFEPSSTPDTTSDSVKNKMSGFEQGARGTTQSLNEETSMPEHADRADLNTANVNDKSALDSKGSIGKQFTTDGLLGGTAQKVGGPLDKDGAVGKQFTENGSLGGAVQALADKMKRDK